MEETARFLALLSLLLISVSWASSSPIHDNFLHCMSTHSQSHSNVSQSIHTPNNASYTQLLQSFIKDLRFMNTTTPKPRFIVTPIHEDEVQAAVICSRKYTLQIRVLSRGHDYEGLSYLCDSPFIIIDLVNLRLIDVDIEDETAWVQAGATIGEVYYRIAEKSTIHGFPAGLCHTVGVGGHFSGGGIGTLSRKYGLAADNIIDAYLVDINGRLLDREAMGEDLFWAIRGGGGASFGVILSWKIKLVHVPSTVTVFTVHKTMGQNAIKLVHQWQYISDKIHEDLFIRINILKIGETTASFNSLFLGSTKTLIPLMDTSFPELGLEAKDCKEMSWIRSVLYFAGYPHDGKLDALLNRTAKEKIFFKAKSDFVKEPISEIVIKGVWKWLLEEDIVFLLLDPLGGRMSRIPESEIPFPHREGNLYNVQYIVKWKDDRIAASTKHLAWIRNLYLYMSPYVARCPRTAYLNYRDLELGINKHGKATYSQAKIWGIKYFKSNFDRLACIKGKVDPDNFFRNEQSIPPTTCMEDDLTT